VSFWDWYGFWKYVFNTDLTSKNYGHITAIAEEGDILSELAEYWTGDANKYEDIATSNNWDNPDLIHPGDQFDVFDVMPKFYRENVGTYSYSKGPNCWNSALSYHDLVQYRVYTDEVTATEKLLANFTSGTSEKAGDVIVYTSDGQRPYYYNAKNNKGGYTRTSNVTHFAIYLADGYAFTKNGFKPGGYLVMPVTEIDKVYSDDVNIGQWKMK
jgi:hypothetical protein